MLSLGLSVDLDEKITHALLLILVNSVELLQIEETTKNLVKDSNIFGVLAEFLEKNPQLSLDTLEEIALLFEEICRRLKDSKTLKNFGPFMSKIGSFLISGINDKISPFDSKPLALGSFFNAFDKII